MKKAHNIYIHVPFCISKCNYCAFFSRACAKPDWETYTNKIISEISSWSQKLGNISVPTIFFGGGTPSLMPTKTFETILNKIKKCFEIISDPEITLESNPGTLSIEKLNDFCSCGVNRLSIGVQSLKDSELQFLGRKHNVKDALHLLESAKKRKLRVSCDFIYGLPNQTIEDVIKACQEINQLELSHCSLYELTIEKNTPFGRMNLEMPKNETMADMYLAIQETLNLPRYEVSNYATPGQECRHNQNVWDGEPYIGLGPGAAGRIFFNDTWYEEIGDNVKFSKITNQERATEKLLTGMRTMRGTELTDDVLNIIDIGFAKSHPDMLRFTDNNRIIATDKGILVLDELISNMIR